MFEKRNRRWSGVALAFLLSFLLLFSSCGQEETLRKEDTTTEAEKTTLSEAEKQENAPDLAQYVISRPDGKDDLLPILTTLRAQIRRKCGIELSLASDLVIANRKEPTYEILLGETRRELSQRLYESLPLGHYAVVYEEGKIALAGRGDEPLQAAVDYFLTHYFQDGVFVLPEVREYRAAYEYDTFYPCLVGKTIHVLGDSYVSPGSLKNGKIWPVLLAEKYGMIHRNYGQSGNAIASAEATGTPMVKRYTQMQNQADIIFVIGGRNDYNKGYPIGAVGDTTTDTFCGALATLLDGLKAKYPNSLILFSTSWYVNEEMKAYTDATLAVCAAKGISCFHAADPALSGVRMSDPLFRATYCVEANDVSHLNAAGMKLVLPKFEKFIGEEAEKFFRD